MFYHVYVLANTDDQTLYIGFTTNLKQRLSDHLSGKGSSVTRKKKNWDLIYFEGYKNKKDVLHREKFLKGGSGRKYLHRQLENYFKEINGQLT